MTKQERGEKRLCQSCGARYYDLRRKPVVCPKCGAEFVAQSMRSVRRAEAKAKPVDVKKPRPAQVKEILVAEVAFADDDELAVLSGDAAEEDDLIEDATDLGKDEEDLAEMLEGGKPTPKQEDL